MKNQKGFSLIELLIVVVIIGIIAAIAIPNLLAARRSANEGSAIASLRTIFGAQATYASTGGNGSYGTLAQLTAPATGLLDTTFGAATAVKSGYTFTVATTAPGAGASATFTANAAPVTPTGLTATGTRYFGIATPGVLASLSTGPVVFDATGQITAGAPIN